MRDSAGVGTGLVCRYVEVGGMSHVTHDQAFDALADPEVPIEDALRLFERAHRRSSASKRDFILDVTGNFRKYGEKPRPAKDRSGT